MEIDGNQKAEPSKWLEFELPTSCGTPKVTEFATEAVAEVNVARRMDAISKDLTALRPSTAESCGAIPLGTSPLDSMPLLPPRRAADPRLRPWGCCGGGHHGLPRLNTFTLGGANARASGGLRLAAP